MCYNVVYNFLMIDFLQDSIYDNALYIGRIQINLNQGKKSFTAYTIDLTKKYIDINADYRS